MAIGFYFVEFGLLHIKGYNGSFTMDFDWIMPCHGCTRSPELCPRTSIADFWE
jgi:hypothetical protein